MRSLRWKKWYFEGALQKARVPDCSSFVGNFLGKKNRSYGKKVGSFFHASKRLCQVWLGFNN
jgi:hypothetical protein